MPVTTIRPSQLETQLTGVVEILAELLVQFRDRFRFQVDSAFG